MPAAALECGAAKVNSECGTGRIETVPFVLNHMTASSLGKPGHQMTHSDRAIDRTFPQSYECEWLLETQQPSVLPHYYYLGASPKGGTRRGSDQNQS
jgi:hypothetical protein